MVNLRLITIQDLLSEKDFPEFIAKKNYQCMKCRNGNTRKINEVVEAIDKKPARLWQALSERGAPDFFIWKNNRYWFCEFKSKSDSLSRHQILWFEKHSDLPGAIAAVIPEAFEKPQRLRWRDFASEVQAYLDERRSAQMLAHQIRWAADTARRYYEEQGLKPLYDIDRDLRGFWDYLFKYAHIKSENAEMFDFDRGDEDDWYDCEWEDDD